MHKYSYQLSLKMELHIQIDSQLVDSHREHLLLLLGLPVFPPLAGLLHLGSAGVGLAKVESEMVSG